MEKIISNILLKGKLVLVILTVLYLLLGIIYIKFPSKYNFDINIGKSEASTVSKELATKFPSAGNENLLISEKIDASNRKTFERIDSIAGVELSEPLEQVGYQSVSVKLNNQEIENTSKKIVAIVEEFNNCQNCSKIGVKGDITNFSRGPKQGTSEYIGIIAAFIVLYFAFGTILTALIPILIAILSIIGATLLLGPITHLTNIPDFAPMMMGLLGVGVGIDYSLFILSRFRSNLRKGIAIEAAIIKSYTTAGVSVIFAGITVIISLLGILIAQVSFLNGLAIASTLGVLFTLINTILLLPLILKKIGLKVIAKKELKNTAHHDLEESIFWITWSKSIQAKPKVFATLGITILLLLTIPASALRIGGSDASQLDQNAPEKVAYNILSDKYGEGFNDPFLVLVPSKNSSKVVNAIASRSEFKILNEINSKDGTESLITVAGDSASHTKKSDDNLILLRNLVNPSNGKIGGLNAFYKDTSDFIKNKLLIFLIGVLGASSLLLLLIFRSIVIMVKATVFNLLVAVASFGVLGAVFQWGWFGEILGSEGDTPLIAFLPILFLAILFGLAMDYQVFLLSRIKEEFDLTQDNSKAITLGLAETGKVITAAALIMIVVFVSFAFTPDLNIKMAGLGLASAIFIDAFIVRSLLVPALMQMFGKYNWYLPKYLAKILPNINLK